MAWRITNKGQLDSVNSHFRATVTAEAGVYGTPGRVGPKYLPGRARLVAPVLAVWPPGGTTQGFWHNRRRRPSRHQ